MNTRPLKRLHPLRLARALLYRATLSRWHTCIICGRHPGGFLPYPQARVPRLMEVLAGVGSNLNNFECPWCGCHDRERHVFMYMTAAGFLPDLSGKSVLHFAPEKRLTGKILAASPERYVKCDLFPQSVGVMKVDVRTMPFDERSFDLLIANHVLEHVSDDAKALWDIIRVLKPGGFAILQTPFSAKLHATWEDAGIDTEEARLEAFGQEDHVRLYGRDIFERFTSAGLESCVSTHDQLLPQYDPKKYGVNEKEPFFLFKRPALR